MKKLVNYFALSSIITAILLGISFAFLAICGQGDLYTFDYATDLRKAYTPIAFILSIPFAIKLIVQQPVKLRSISISTAVLILPVLMIHLCGIIYANRFAGIGSEL